MITCKELKGVCNIDWSLFLSAGVFPPVWYKHVSEIAAKSPLLLSMGAEQFLDKELEVNHPLKIENIVPVSPQAQCSTGHLYLRNTYVRESYTRLEFWMGRFTVSGVVRLMCSPTRHTTSMFLQQPVAKVRTVPTNQIVEILNPGL